jgi:hypothetical protein
MGREHEPRNECQKFEIGDEVIGDERIRGTIIRTNDAHQPLGRSRSDAVRQYFVKSENGEKFLYAGESNLRLVKKGMGDAAPPRPDLFRELEEDLKNRPLIGIRL